MKKIVLLIFFIIYLSFCKAYSAENDALQFFDRFVTLSNQWGTDVIALYDTNPVIKRNVLKKTPILVIVPFEEHKKMLINYSKHKILLKGIRNDYKDKKVTNLGNNKYKISAQRCPTVMRRCFPAYLIIQKQNDQFRIIEEYSDVQTTYFLRFKDKK